MKLLAIISICMTLTILNRADANLPGLSSTYAGNILQTRHLILSQNLLGGPNPTSCHQQILNIAADGVIDITMAFGYMDVTAGQDYQDSADHMYRNGDVLDYHAKEGMKAVLMQRCERGSNQACGFKANGEFLEKRMTNRFTGRSITARILLLAPSVSTSDAQNRSTYQKQQQQRSEQTKAKFLYALTSSDAVIYMGHARSGGGPDFLPPVLRGNGTVNYSHYQQQQKGIRDMVAALKHNPATTPVIGVLACNSSGLFASRIRQASPGSILVTASELFDYNDILPTGYAMLEALLGQRCTDSFAKVTKVHPRSSRFIDIRF